MDGCSRVPPPGELLRSREGKGAEHDRSLRRLRHCFADQGRDGCGWGRSVQMCAGTPPSQLVSPVRSGTGHFVADVAQFTPKTVENAG